MLEYEEALARILAAIPATSSERVPLTQAHRRFLAERLLAPLDLPPFDNSAMDGYAVRAEDVAGASSELPKSLRLSGRVAAGENFSGTVEPGGCIRVFTGSPLPQGADAVVMQEDTRTETGRPDTVLFLDAVKPWENVRFRGEDVKRASVIGEPGLELSAGRIGLFAAVGLTEAAVGSRPKVGLLASGSELTEAGQPLAPGAIYESNRTALMLLLNCAGTSSRIFPLVKDAPDEMRQALAAAFAECDVVVTSGGVSVGEHDFTRSAFMELGGELQFWKVAIRPGRPFVFGHWRGKFLFGLPGNPVSAFVTFLLLVYPALRRWQGAAEAGLPRQWATLAEPLSNLGDRRHFLRMRIDAAGQARSAGAQASHILSSLASANALLDLPPRTILPAGAAIECLRWELA